MYGIGGFVFVTPCGLCNSDVAGDWLCLACAIYTLLVIVCPWPLVASLCQEPDSGSFVVVHVHRIAEGA